MKKGRTVLVGGCFDVLHYGHIQFLKKAKQEGDILIVALESDEFIFKRKKRKPFHSQAKRTEILKSLRMVDEVVELPFLYSDEEYMDFVKKIKPSVIAITKGDRQLANKKKQASVVGGLVKIVTPLLKNFSTTSVIRHAFISRH